MIALDTNILARAIVEEAQPDAATLRQQRSARDLLASEKALFVPVIVVQELEWVLRAIYGLRREVILELLEDLLLIENMTVDRATAVAFAIGACRKGVDFSDALHLAQSRQCHQMASFDAQFRKLGKRLNLEPEVVTGL
jgi:predicted nucleic-acid-binding protein